MTTIYYNGVILRDCETKSFDQTVEYDPSGTDLLFSRFTIRVASTLVATSYPLKSFGIETNTGATVTQRAKEVHRMLSEPRKDFYMLIDNSVNHERNPTATVNESMLTATGDLTSGDGAMPIYPPTVGFSVGTVSRASVADVNNGPKPTKISITEIVAGRSMRVEFEIEVCRKLCIPVYPDLKPDEEVWGAIETPSVNVLSNRWHLSETKDENWITTRTLEGEVRVVNAQFWPHLMRAICVPPLMLGYKRVRQVFTDDPTGLVLKYTVEDRQAHAAPPYPAIAWSGHHAEMASGPNGSILTAEFSIKLTGPPGVDKVQLIGAAGKIAVDRIAGLVPDFVGGQRESFTTQLQNAAIVNILHEPTIEMRVQAKYTGGAVSSRALGVRVNDMGKPLTTLTGTDPYEVEEYDPQVWPVPLAYDSPTPAGIFACYLQNPCSVWHDMPDGTGPVTSGSEETDEENAGRSLNSPSGRPDYHPSTIIHMDHELPPDTTYLKTFSGGMSTVENIYDFPYTFVELESRYEINNGWTQMPLADVSPAATRTAALIKLHGSTAKRILTMTATRDGQLPVIPDLAERTTDPNGIKEALNDVFVTAKAPQLLASGQSRRFSVMTEYHYLLERAPRPNELLRIGSTQLDRIQPSQNRIDLSIQQDGGAMQTPGASW